MSASLRPWKRNLDSIEWIFKYENIMNILTQTHNAILSQPK